MASIIKSQLPLLLGLLMLAACSKTTLSSGNAPQSAAEATTAATAVNAAAAKSAKAITLSPNLCTTLRMEDSTQQLIYLRSHAAVKHDPQQTILSNTLTSITYATGDVKHYQQGLALITGTAIASLPPTATDKSNMDERILFFGLPKGSHLNIMTVSGLQWRDQDIETDTYVLSLTELPRGKYRITLNGISFFVELK